MALWEWAVAAYARPGVADLCLELQDAYGQNTCLLLWAAWARPDDAQWLEKAATVARDWDRQAIRPLRSVRRALKAPSLMADASREALRAQVKAVELQAERVLLETLEVLAPRKGHAGLADSLAGAARAWSHAEPPKPLAALAAALEPDRSRFTGQVS